MVVQSFHNQRLLQQKPPLSHLNFMAGDNQQLLPLQIGRPHPTAGRFETMLLPAVSDSSLLNRIRQSANAIQTVRRREDLHVGGSSAALMTIRHISFRRE